MAYNFILVFEHVYLENNTVWAQIQTLSTLTVCDKFTSVQTLYYY